MTENMKKFLEAISKDNALCDKSSNATNEDLMAMAKALGIELTEADFTQPSGELSEDELSAVAGGQWCACTVGGGGTASKGEKTCACVGCGFGYNTDGSMRCGCAAAGVGAS